VTVLVVFDDPNLLDLLTRVFEARKLNVATAATKGQAVTALESGRTIDVIVAAWDDAHPVGGEVYRWVLKNRVALRAHFVFVGDDVPAEFDRVVAGRCLAVRPGEAEELVRVVEATARRNERAQRLGDQDLSWLDSDRPALLLVEGDPMQLMVMASLLGDVGFRLTGVESGNAAIAQLEQQDFDVIVTCWHMPDGSGADLYRWVCTMRPWLLDRLLVLTGASPAEVEPVAVGVPVVPKGQDSGALLALLAATARRTRGAA
jgi:CheY-like chemotaxis protein